MSDATTAALVIRSNVAGTIHFADLNEVSKFAFGNACRVSNMLELLGAALDEGIQDSGAMSYTVDAVADLAYQVSQAVELVHRASVQATSMPPSRPRPGAGAGGA